MLVPLAAKTSSRGPWTFNPKQPAIPPLSPPSLPNDGNRVAYHTCSQAKPGCVNAIPSILCKNLLILPPGPPALPFPPIPIQHRPQEKFFVIDQAEVRQCRLVL